MLTRAPPELPGVIAAPVSVAASPVFWLPDSPVVDTGRFRLLTIPVVTVPARPSGDPIATTDWPTCRSDEEPMEMGVSPETPCTRITAISLVGSAPTTVNVAVRPSEKVTVVFGAGLFPPLAGGLLPPPPPAGGLPEAGAAVAMTWLLVRTSPSADRMMPEPSSD